MPDDAPQRRNLLAGLTDKQTRPEISDETISDAGRDHGYPSSNKTTVATTDEGSTPEIARKRVKIGRTHQLNVRIKPQTASDIYAIANARDIPIAQVLEEALAALTDR